MTSLTLLVHMVMLRQELPDNDYTILKAMLKVLRLDFLSLIDAESYHHGNSVPPDDLFVAGYQSTQFLTNLGPLLTAIVFIPALLSVLGFIKNCLTPRSCKNSRRTTCSSQILHFATRIV